VLIGSGGRPLNRCTDLRLVVAHTRQASAVFSGEERQDESPKTITISRAAGALLALAVVALCAAALASTASAAQGPAATATPPPNASNSQVVRADSGGGPGEVGDVADEQVLTQSGPTTKGGFFQKGNPQVQPPTDGGNVDVGNAPVEPRRLARHATTYCRDYTAWKAGYNVFGATMWKIWNHTHWCYNYSTVTYVTGYVDTYTGLGWSTASRSWGWSWWNPNWEARTHAAAHFKLTSLWITIQEAWPNVYVFAYYNGYAYYS